MENKLRVTNLKTKNAKLRTKPAGRTNLKARPEQTGLASGLTANAIKAFRLAKEQRQKQAAAE